MAGQRYLDATEGKVKEAVNSGKDHRHGTANPLSVPSILQFRQSAIHAEVLLKYNKSLLFHGGNTERRLWNRRRWGEDGGLSCL